MSSINIAKRKQYYPIIEKSYFLFLSHVIYLFHIQYQFLQLHRGNTEFHLKN